MTINGISQISTYIQNIYEDAVFVARDNNVMTALVTTFSDRGDEDPRTLSQHSQVTVNTIGDTDDLASQAFTPSVLATLTPAEVGAQYFLDDRRIASDPFGVRNAASSELGMGIAQKYETDLISNFSSFTGGTLGAAGSAMTWGYFFAAESILRAQKAPFPYYAVLNPYQWHNLAKAASVAGATVLNAPQFQNDIMANFYVGSVGAVNVFVTSNVVPDGSDDAVAGMFSRAAIALDNRRPPRLEPERDASRRGWELNMTAVYAHGVWRAQFGVQITADASAPTS